VFLVDNSANWSRSSQHWPDGNGNQGQAELLALKNALSGIEGSQHVNVGLAMYGKEGNDYGGYLRFGARDMAVPASRTALFNILDGIGEDVNSSDEKVAQNEGESKALYELLQYYRGAAPFFGGSKTRTPNLDIAGNNGGHTPFTTVGQLLTSNFAVNGGLYTPPAVLDDCRRHFVILIANNANGTMPAGSQTYQGTNAGSSIAGTSESWTDEWARLLYQQGISVYVLDAYNAQNNAAYSKVLRSAAANGGGKYYQVGSQAAIEQAIKEILVEIQSVNSTFASASLPVSTTNRAQSLNQVFIGMFRPDADAKPRWVGNLKRFQLTRFGSNVGLGDVLNVNAVNPQTGFVGDCSASFWTKHTESYWADVPVAGLAASACPNFPLVDGLQGSAWSDLPDGPRWRRAGWRKCCVRATRRLPPTRCPPGCRTGASGPTPPAARR
jgi:type IV pilus assembly protein PilY1